MLIYRAFRLADEESLSSLELNVKMKRLSRQQTASYSSCLNSAALRWITFSLHVSLKGLKVELWTDENKEADTANGEIECTNVNLV